LSADPTTLGLVEVAARIRDGSLSSVAATTALLARAEAVQPRLNCFLAIDAPGALRAAAAADAARARGAPLGALHGVPLAHKDMFDIAGEPIRYGSRVRGAFVPAQTATVIARLEAAGAIRIGALNMAEFALGATGHNAIWGDCRNAVDPDYMAGGSSSGSGAAVAAFAAYASLGSDTGGSVRIPAAANGVVGLKATYGRIPRSGAMKLSPSADHLGPLTRSVRDCARMLSILAGHDPRDPASSARPVPDYEAECGRDIRGLRIGVPRNYFYDVATPEIRAAMEASLAALEREGARCVELDVPDVAAMSELSRAIVYSEATALHGAWLRERPGTYSPQVRVRASTGIAIPASVYLEALLLRMPLLERFVGEVFSRCEVLHSPTLPVPVPRLEEVDVGGGAAMWAMLAKLVHNTAPFNYLGLPAIAVPAGRTANGLPASAQLAARPFAEGLLIRVAAAHERALQASGSS
jgi:aspartyl-tRNA(Asn)/glutamyl-tRNA(Gln) amidotransferase subunit A